MLRTHKQEVEVEYSTLKRTVKNKEEEGRKRLSIMEVSRIHHVYSLSCQSVRSVPDIRRSS